MTQLDQRCPVSSNTTSIRKENAIIDAKHLYLFLFLFPFLTPAQTMARPVNFMRTATWDAFTLNVSPTSTIHQIKGMIFDHVGTGYEVDRVLPSYNGRILSDDRIFEAVNVENEKFVQVICKVRPPEQTIVIPPTPVIAVSCFNSVDLYLAFQPSTRKVSCLMRLLKFSVVDCQDKLGTSLFLHLET